MPRKRTLIGFGGHKANTVWLTDVCDIIAWYLIGVPRKHIRESFTISNYHLDGYLTRFHVPRRMPRARSATCRTRENPRQLHNGKQSCSGTQRSFPLGSDGATTFPARGA